DRTGGAAGFPLPCRGPVLPAGRGSTACPAGGRWGRIPVNGTDPGPKKPRRQARCGRAGVPIMGGELIHLLREWLFHVESSSSAVPPPPPSLRDGDGPG